MESLRKPAMAMLIVTVAVLSSGIDVPMAEGLCNMSTEDLETCKPSISGPTPTEPSAECCSALAGADLVCLCSYRNSPLLPAFGIDPDLAMQLPVKCKLTPPAQC